MKKLLTTILTLALAFLMAFSFTACKNESGDGGSTDKDGNTIVKIMFHVDSSSSEGKAYQKRVNAFNAEYKDKKIKIWC